MSKKIKNRNEYRRKKKPRTLEEPEKLASEKTNESGRFVNKEESREKNNNE